ncbi:MAG: transcription-repair coupling factor [Firmicutes bacterium]|nr:transcription-repair coupling factor [Bacillota bacterium]
MNRIYQYIEKKDPVKKYIAAILSGMQRIHIENTTEEQGLLLMAYAYEKSDKHFVVVCPNLYNAQMTYDRLSQFIHEDSLSFFPQDEFITSELLVSSMEFKMERMNTIRKLLSSNKQLIVTHPAGVLKPQLSREVWKDSIFTLFENLEFSRDKLAETLVDYGYSKEYTVEKPGDFSVRGGIVDIYLTGEKNPVRLDFFGDSIESIKYFNIESQRSFENIKEIEIVPMTEFLYSSKMLKDLEKLIQSKLEMISFSDSARNRILEDLSRLQNHQELDRLNRYIPFITKKHLTILDLIEKPTVFFMDYHRIIDQYDLMVEEISDWYLSTDDYPKMSFELLYSLHELNYNQGVFIDFFEFKYKQTFDTALSFFGKEVLSFQGNTELFISDIRSDIANKTVIITASSLKMRTEIVDMMELNHLKYQLLTDNDLLYENQINIIVSDHFFDITSDTLGLRVITEPSIFKLRNIRRKGRYVSVYETSKRLSSINELKPGDFVVHYDYGIGKFLEISSMQMGATLNDYIHIEYRDGDKLYIPLESFHQIQKYSGSEGFVPRLSKLGGSDWAKAKQRVRQKAKDIADKLIKLYADREKSQGFSYFEYSDFEKDFENDFPYEETRDQNKAISEVLNDMSLPRPMDRLLCGDVGFGKTEVALRAAFRAVLNKKQVAYLAPTTVLSKQHYNTFKDRMEKYGIQVRLLNRFVSKKEQKGILEGLARGTVDVVIGTHRILSKDMVFKDLGLLVIDEEQRFGVLHKERIKEMKVNVDVLSLSATPIPRTLQMAIMGVKNMSLLETAPENRYPIQTYVLERNDTLIKDAIERELMRKGQVFYLYNRIEDIENIASKVQKLVPQARIQVAHGQMHKHDLEDVVDDFINQDIDVLISTTIIETGIDIPNANTLIIHDADKLGLSQLYQIRGRVGRTNRIAYAYLMYYKDKVLTEEALKRLKVIKEFTELGSGFKIAVRDLSIRGAGDVLGSEQSGFIDSVGIDLYMKILEEEIKEKQGIIEDQISSQGVKTRVSKYIDKKYIEDDFVKIEMHKKIQNVKNLDELKMLSEELKDRFGGYDEELEIYMYERLFEVLTKEFDIEKISESKTNITLIVSVMGSKKIAGEDVFTSGMHISPYLRFAYKNEKIRFILDTIELNKHWLYTMVEFLDSLQKKNENN